MKAEDQNTVFDVLKLILNYENGNYSHAMAEEAVEIMHANKGDYNKSISEIEELFKQAKKHANESNPNYELYMKIKSKVIFYL